MKTIELIQGQVALVDDADFESMNRFNWCALKKEGCFTPLARCESRMATRR